MNIYEIYKQKKEQEEIFKNIKILEYGTTKKGKEKQFIKIEKLIGIANILGFIIDIVNVEIKEDAVLVCAGLVYEGNIISKAYGYADHCDQYNDMEVGHQNAPNISALISLAQTKAVKKLLLNNFSFLILFEESKTKIQQNDNSNNNYKNINNDSLSEYKQFLSKIIREIYNVKDEKGIEKIIEELKNNQIKLKDSDRKYVWDKIQEKRNKLKAQSQTVSVSNIFNEINEDVPF